MMEATETDLAALRAEVLPEDFVVIADDLMYYRSTAHEVLAGLDVPVVRLHGRRPLEFRVDGGTRVYDFADIEWLDVLVLYLPGQEPRAVATVEAEVARAFFR